MGMVSTNEFKKRMKIMFDAQPCMIVENEFVKPGKGQAFNRVKLKNLITGRQLEKTFKSGDTFEEFRRAVLKLPHVLECHLVSGDFDYLVKARINEMASYRKLLGDILLKLPHVRESKSYIVMEEVKESLNLPIPE